MEREPPAGSLRGPEKQSGGLFSPRTGGAQDTKEIARVRWVSTHRYWHPACAQARNVSLNALPSGCSKFSDRCAFWPR